MYYKLKQIQSEKTKTQNNNFNKQKKFSIYEENRHFIDLKEKQCKKQKKKTKKKQKNRTKFVEKIEKEIICSRFDYVFFFL